MRWCCAVTTVPGREYLSATLRSLDRAGFSSPTVVTDEQCWGVAYCWTRALHELFCHNRTADRFAVFQDDVLARVGLRAYLERWFPADGYLNLYTAYENERDPGRPRTGWFRASQRGRGALGLVFDREGVLTLLSSAWLWDNVCGQHAKGIDGVVVNTMKRAGKYEYCHGTSLLQHAGHQSAANNGTARETPRTSGVFPGESVDPATEAERV